MHLYHLISVINIKLSLNGIGVIFSGVNNDRRNVFRVLENCSSGRIKGP